jgi:ribonucleoside-diphosphate reductase alpha chain
VKERGVTEQVSPSADDHRAEPGKTTKQNYVDKGDVCPECPECGSMVEYVEGCVVCRTCGFSKCW